MAKVNIKSVPSKQPRSSKEVAIFIDTLRANKQVVPSGKPLIPGATHEESKDLSGKTTVVRKRFSAV